MLVLPLLGWSHRLAYSVVKVRRRFRPLLDTTSQEVELDSFTLASCLVVTVVSDRHYKLRRRRRIGFIPLSSCLPPKTAARPLRLQVVPEAVVLVPGSREPVAPSETAPIYYSGVPPISQ